MKIRIILPYFGKLNNYFKLWLNSCKMNLNIDWLIFTDEIIDFDIPNNVEIVNISFETLKNIIQNKFKDIKIWLNNPYKLCDYKQFYGYIFSEYLTDYDFWGYCDCDVIWGCLSSFLSDDILSNYDKILRTGHLSLIRNTKDINENFKKYDTYKVILTSSVIYGYDESIKGFRLGFAGELMANGYSFYRNDEIVADVDFRHFPFRIVSKPGEICVFLYEHGHIYKLVLCGGEVIKTEMAYLHLQKRQMIIEDKIDEDKFLVIPNKIIKYDSSLLDDSSFWLSVSKEKDGYFDNKQEYYYEKKRQIKRFLHEPHKLRSISYRLKGTK